MMLDLSCLAPCLHPSQTLRPAPATLSRSSIRLSFLWIIVTSCLASTMLPHITFQFFSLESEFAISVNPDSPCLYSQAASRTNQGKGDNCGSSGMLSHPVEPCHHLADGSLALAVQHLDSGDLCIFGDTHSPASYCCTHVGAMPVTVKSLCGRVGEAVPAVVLAVVR